MTSPSPWASVIIPIKDERENLSPLMAGLTNVMDSYELSQSRPYEIIFVDDGSSDGSSEELDRLAKEDKRVHVYHFDRNYGKTCALEAAFISRQARSSFKSTAISNRTAKISSNYFLIPRRTTWSVAGGNSDKMGSSKKSRL